MQSGAESEKKKKKKKTRKERVGDQACQIQQLARCLHAVCTSTVAKIRCPKVPKVKYLR